MLPGSEKLSVIGVERKYNTGDQSQDGDGRE
jgi:hypothetical protein